MLFALLLPRGVLSGIVLAALLIIGGFAVLLCISYGLYCVGL